MGRVDIGEVIRKLCRPTRFDPDDLSLTPINAASHANLHLLLDGNGKNSLHEADMEWNPASAFRPLDRAVVVDLDPMRGIGMLGA